MTALSLKSEASSQPAGKDNGQSEKIIVKDESSGDMREREAKAPAGGNRAAGPMARDVSARQFAEVFTKPTDIYRKLARYHQFRPLFLRRNLWYMKPNAWSPTQNRQPSSTSIHPHWQRRKSPTSSRTCTSPSRSSKRRYLTFAEKESRLNTLCKNVLTRSLHVAAGVAERGSATFELLPQEVVEVGEGEREAADKRREYRMEFFLVRQGYHRRKQLLSRENKVLISEAVWNARFPPPLLRVSIAASLFGGGCSGGVKTPLMTQEKLFVRIRRICDANCPIVILDDVLEDEHKAKKRRFNSGEEAKQEQLSKEKKSFKNASSESRSFQPNLYEATLPIYDYDGKCFLPVGSYEVKLKAAVEKPAESAAAKVGSSSMTPGLKRPAPKGYRWIVANPDSEMSEALEKKLKDDPGLVLKADVKWTKTHASTDVIHPVLVDPSTFYEAKRAGLVHRKASERAAEREKRVLEIAAMRRKLQREAPAFVMYRFWAGKKKISCQKLPGVNLKCLFCLVSCPTLYSLLKHCCLCHPRLNFHYAAVPGNGAQIDVSINAEYNGSFSGNPAERSFVESSGFLLSRSQPVCGSRSTTIMLSARKLFGKDWRPKPTLAEFFPVSSSSEHAGERYPNSAMSEYHRSYSTGHRRLYYRSITCLPAPSVDHVGDSDDENDPDWLKKKTCLMIDEFTDVNEGEKALMKAWNLHVLKHNFAGDCQMDLAVAMFLQDKREWLVESRLARNFCCHVQNLYTFGLVRMSTVLLAAHAVNTLASEVSKVPKTEPVES